MRGVQMRRVKSVNWAKEERQRERERERDYVSAITLQADVTGGVIARMRPAVSCTGSCMHHITHSIVGSSGLPLARQMPMPMPMMMMVVW